VNVQVQSVLTKLYLAPGWGNSIAPTVK